MGIQPSVGIIGAGIAGLVTAKVLKADGFKLTVFDKASEIGGTWTQANTYPGLRTNNSKRTYEFSDLPYPDEVADHPTHDEVRAYLNSYVDHSGLRDVLVLDTKVNSVRRKGRGFALTVEDLMGGTETKTVAFDRLVVCNGIFHQPIVPDLPGSSEFKGSISHSSEASDDTFAEDGALAVVGGGKSAYDIAEEAGRRGLDVTLVVRSPQWRAPRFTPEGTPGDYGLYIRELHQLMPFYADDENVLAAKSAAAAMCQQLWEDFSDQFTEALGIPASLTPDRKLPAGLSHLAAGGELYELVRNGRVKIERSGVAKLGSGGLTTEAGTFVPASRIVFGTGWQPDYSFFDNDLAVLLFDENERLGLYKNMVAPDVAGIAFNGHASSFSNTLTAEICAHWISEHFQDRFELPSSEEMRADIKRFREWADRWLVERPCDSFVGPFHIPYVFMLLDEISGGDRLIATFGDDPRRPLLPSLFSDITKFRQDAVTS